MSKSTKQASIKTRTTLLLLQLASLLQGIQGAKVWDLKPIRFAIYTTPTELQPSTIDSIQNVVGQVMQQSLTDFYQDTTFGYDKVDWDVVKYTHIYKVDYGITSDVVATNGVSSASVSTSDADSGADNGADSAADDADRRHSASPIVKVRIPKENHGSHRSLATETMTKSSSLTYPTHEHPHEHPNEHRQLQEKINGTEIILGGNITFLGDTFPSRNRASTEVIQVMKGLVHDIRTLVQQLGDETSQVDFLKVSRFKGDVAPTPRPTSSPSITPSATPTFSPKPTISTIPTPSPSFKPSISNVNDLNSNEIVEKGGSNGSGGTTAGIITGCVLAGVLLLGSAGFLYYKKQYSHVSGDDDDDKDNHDDSANGVATRDGLVVERNQLSEEERKQFQVSDDEEEGQVQAQGHDDYHEYIEDEEDEMVEIVRVEIAA